MVGGGKAGHRYSWSGGVCARVAFGWMSERKELPQQITDLVELTKQYLRQETVDPLRRIGQSVATALAGGLLVGLGVVLLSMGLHLFLTEVLPGGQGWTSAAAAIVAVVFFLAALTVAARLRSGSEQ